MIRITTVLLSALAVGSLAFPVLADDPFLTEDTSACGLGSSWCLNAGVGLDTQSKMTTLVYVFDPNKITSVVAGDWQIKEADNTIGDLLRFETLTSSLTISNPDFAAPTSFSAGDDFVFVYSADVGGGSPADVGLPTFDASAPSAVECTTAAECGDRHHDFQPTSSQAGFVTVPANSPFQTPAIYELNSVDAPEPSVVSLLASMIAMIALGGLALRLRRKQAGEIGQ